MGGAIAANVVTIGQAVMSELRPGMVTSKCPLLKRCAVFSDAIHGLVVFVHAWWVWHSKVDLSLRGFSVLA